MTAFTTRPAASVPSIDELRSRFEGRVIGPEDADYDKARAITARDIDRHPAVIVRVANDDDVRRVVDLARETGTELAVRSGGHSGAGHSTTEGGIVLDLRDMRAISVDVKARAVWAEAGLTALEVNQATEKHGLVVGFGDSGSVGIGGATTGGGVGYLGRLHGLTIDNLLAADVVTADGQVQRADADTNPDLFWAIRGGGGNFGVVTRFQYRLADLPGIVGGMLFLPATPQTVQRFVELSEEAPDAFSSIAKVMPCPPLPMVDEGWHGKLVILGLVCYAGRDSAGQEVLRPFRELGKLAGVDSPIADVTHAMPYTGMFQPEEGGEDYRPPRIATTLFIDRVDHPTAETIMHRLEALLGAPMPAAQLRVLGGAIGRVPADATAYAHRKSRIMVNLAAFYHDEEERVARQAWVNEFASAIRQSDQGAFVSFIGDEGESRVRAAYPGATWDRLARIKRRYDPYNLFRLNQNIPPAA